MEGYEGYVAEDAGSEHNPVEIKEMDEPSSGSSSKGFGGNTSMREETPVGEGSFSMMSRRSRRSSPETSMQQQQPRSMSLFSNSAPEEMRSGSPGSSRRSSSSRAAAVAAAAAAAVPQVLAAKDKENMPPPPAFRRPTLPASKRLSFAAEEVKPVAAAAAAASRAPSPAEEREYRSLAPALAAAGSPERKHVLSTKSNNTPLRPPPPPPPPKMSMLEAVTASAGASATAAQQSSRKQRSVVHVNGKPYRRLDAIGKGGSSKVYKVMAENFKILAMKKVTFTAQDGESAIRGYKGEIDLLKKLAHVDRVVRLYDWEINDGKQCLTMLMECGETDLAKVLMMRHNNEDSQMDISFVRYYWREMLLCVESVHKLNIIHSDLKPANFLVVQGRLKLIDFGIANAIADDTVNVHRESQVGTLNYMSPEAIVDINAASGKAMASVGAPRLMKLGAPSDVWSLGCILYQMTYGRGPFAHLTSMYQKINAIPDPNYAIDYPGTGIGGAPVPASLVATISGCLRRDKGERPTIAQMLSYDDPFLNPDTCHRPVRREEEGVVDISYEVLKMLMENTVEHVRLNGAADKERVAAWATDVYAKLERRMLESRGVQR
ncbi:kinase-like domain-containing protein [Morchella snyderi]|nr:kinase-like domain-containing protein [Morchella snyderi]